MNLETVRHDIAEAVRELDGLRQVHEYPPGSVVAPCVILQPQRVEPTARDGELHELGMTLIIVAGRPNDRSAHKRLDSYAPGGSASISDHLESKTFASFETIEFDEFLWDSIIFGSGPQAVEYLVGLESFTIAGDGE